MRALKMLLVAAVVAPVAVSAKPHPVRWQARPARVVDGTATVVVRVTMERGWFVYGLTQPAGGPRPLVFRIASGTLARVGRVTAPAAKVEFDEGFRARVGKHVGSTEFTVPVHFAGPAPRMVRLQVRYQACNGSICLPPRTEIVEARLTRAE